MNKLFEEIHESEFFISRKLYIFPVSKIKLEIFIKAIYNLKEIMIHNFFIFEYMKFSIMKYLNRFKTYFNRKDINFNLNRNKKKFKAFYLFLKNIKNKNNFLNEKFIQNWKVRDIRHEIRWKFIFVQKSIFLNDLKQRFNLFVNLLIFLLKNTNYTKNSSVKKICVIVISLIQNRIIK
jgi:hypothetical protein